MEGQTCLCYLAPSNSAASCTIDAWNAATSRIVTMRPLVVFGVVDDDERHDREPIQQTWWQPPTNQPTNHWSMRKQRNTTHTHKKEKKCTTIKHNAHRKKKTYRYTPERCRLWLAMAHYWEILLARRRRTARRRRPQTNRWRFRPTRLRRCRQPTTMFGEQLSWHHTQRQAEQQMTKTWLPEASWRDSRASGRARECSGLWRAQQHVPYVVCSTLRCPSLSKHNVCLVRVETSRKSLWCVVFVTIINLQLKQIV